jgi:hypothetical protein
MCLRVLCAGADGFVWKHLGPPTSSSALSASTWHRRWIRHGEFAVQKPHHRNGPCLPARGQDVQDRRSAEQRKNASTFHPGFVVCEIPLIGSPGTGSQLATARFWHGPRPSLAFIISSVNSLIAVSFFDRCASPKRRQHRSPSESFGEGNCQGRRRFAQARVFRHQPRFEAL